jgi:hypothetical protein
MSKHETLKIRGGGRAREGRKNISIIRLPRAALFHTTTTPRRLESGSQPCTGEGLKIP